MRLVLSCWCIALGCLSADPGTSTGSATPATGSANKEPAADYGAAFGRLVELGYPDARGATYVKLTLRGEAGREAAERAMYERQSGAGLPVKGNAWLLPGGTAAATAFIHQGLDRVTVAKTAKRSGFMRALIGPAKASKDAPQGALAGSWEEVDVTRDAEKILNLLDEQSTEGRMLSMERWSYDEDGPTWCATILGLACHMHRAGHRDEANRITARLLALAPEPVLVVDYLVHDLAEREYERTVAAFFENHDWQAYHDATKALVERFTRGWKTREGARVLLSRLDRQLNGANPSLSALQGVLMEPEAVGILDSWLGETKPIPLTPKPCWLLGGDMLAFAEQQGHAGRRPGGDGPPPGRVAELHALGMDAFIALAAAADDETLLPTRMVRGYGGYLGSFGRGVGDNTGEPPGVEQYKSMTRPASRGEVARTILLDALPDQMGELQNSPPEAIQAAAHQWWLKNRNATPSELASIYLESGNSQQRQVAALALAHSNNDENAKAVEKHIMEAGDLTDHFHLVDQHLRIRRGKARAFFQNYSAAIRDLAGAGGGGTDPFGVSDNWQIREAGGMDRYLKKLSVYVDDVSPEKVLADIRRGDLAYEEGFPMLGAAMQGKSIATHLPALVKVARNQETPDEQLKVLRAIQRLVGNDDPDHDSGEEHDALRGTYGAQVARSKDDWSYFLAQDTPAEGDLYGTAPTFAAAAAWTFELIYFNQHSETMVQLSQIMDGEALWEFCLDRARRVLEEGPASAFPVMADADRREAIRRTLAPMSSAEVLQHFKTLDLGEKLAWSEIVTGYENGTPDGVAGLYKHVTRINWPGLDRKHAPLKRELEDLTHAQVLDKALVKAVLGHMLARAEHYQQFVVYFQTNGRGTTGVTLSVIGTRRMEDWHDRILGDAYGLLRESKARKAAGLYMTDEHGADLIGHLYEPARKDHDFSLEAPVDRIDTLIAEGRRFHGILAVETSKHLRKRDAEREGGGNLPPSS